MDNEIRLFEAREYARMISRDFQLDKLSEDHLGFIKINPEDSGKWTDIATHIAKNPNLYQTIFEDFGLEIENGSNAEEMVITELK